MSIDISKKIYKYDQTASKYYHLIFIGVAIVVINYSTPQQSSYRYDPIEAIEDAQNAAMMNLVLRIIATVIAVYAAKSLNRSKTVGVFAFLLPPLTLIVMGFLKKKTYPKNYNKLTDKEKSKVNRIYAYKLFKDGKFDLALEFIEEAINFDEDNANNFCIKGLIITYNSQGAEGLEVIEKSLEMGDFNKELYLERGKAFMKHNKKSLAKDDFEKAVYLDDEISKRLHRGKDVHYLDVDSYFGQIRKIRKYLDQERDSYHEN